MAADPTLFAARHGSSLLRDGSSFPRDAVASFPRDAVASAGRPRTGACRRLPAGNRATRPTSAGPGGVGPVGGLGPVGPGGGRFAGAAIGWVRLARVLAVASVAALTASSVARAQGADAGAAAGTAEAPVAAAPAAVAPVAGASVTASGPTVELNRLEDAGGGCRLTLVLSNPGSQRFDELKLDLVLFDGDGIVARRLAVETGPVRANKTVVRLFEAADLPCAGIGRLLLNDVVACAGEDGPVSGCLDGLATASRAAVPFER